MNPHRSASAALAFDTADPCPLEWLASDEDYALAGRTADARIPVLRPQADEQERLWRRVVATQFVRPAERAARPERLILAWGAEALRPARVYARYGGSPVIDCGSLEECVARIEGCTETNVLVVASARRLCIAAVTRMSSAARTAGRGIGFLCGRTEASLSFSVAKLLLRPGVAAGGEFLDAPHHDQRRNALGTPDEIIRRLTEPSLFKIIRSHGEGSHAKLPGVVICGLLEQTEFAHAPDQGCSRDERRCKRARASGARVVFGHEVATPVIGFACCNGFNVASELYPSPMSMALSLVEGGAAAIIAPARPLIVPDAAMDRLYCGLAGGEPLGALVQALNEMSEKNGQSNAFVLHGDPLYALPPSVGEAPGERAATFSRAATGSERSADVPRADQSAADLSTLQQWLVGLSRQTQQGRRLLRSTEAWLGENQAGAVAPLAARLDRIERLALNAIKWAESHPAADSRRVLQRFVVPIRLAVAQWDKEMATMLLGTRSHLDAYDIGHYDQVRIDVREGPGCRRCGTPVEIHRFGRDAPAQEHRLATLCCVCGPVSEHRADGMRLSLLSSPKQGETGGRFALRAALTVPASAPVARGVQLFLRFYDKANDCCVYEELRKLPAESQAVDFAFELPGNLGTELHSIHMLAACGFEIAYARARFAAVPRPTST
jgi:hypothetical protein